MNRRADLGAGEVVGDKYVVDRRLGEGGMGTVYLARHSMTDRKVALKWVPLDDELTRERTLIEARSMGRLSHPNVVGVLDAGQHGDAVFLVMEYLSGKTLRAHVDGRSLSPAEAIDLLMPALCGVVAAHQAGVLHRDLKPDNLFVCMDHKGVAFDTKVLDFGVAKEMKDGAVSSLTNAGMIVGTPKYMAPEQLASGPKLDFRADVYALGLILYELLTGRLPYDTGDIRTMAVAILRGALIPLEVLRPDLPAELCAVVTKSLATDRGDRHADTTAFARALEPFAGTRRFEAPRKMRATMDGEISEAITAPEFGVASARTRRDPMPVQPSITTPNRQGKREAQGRDEPDRADEAGASATRDERGEGAGDAPRGKALVAGAPVGALAAAAARARAGPDVAARDSGGHTLRGPHQLRRAAARAVQAPGASATSEPPAHGAVGRWVALAFAALVVLGAAWTLTEFRAARTDAASATPEVPAAAAGGGTHAPSPTVPAVPPPNSPPATGAAPAAEQAAQAARDLPATPPAAADHAPASAPAAAPAAADVPPATRSPRPGARTTARAAATTAAPTSDRPAKPTPSKVQAAGGTLRSDDF